MKYDPNAASSNLIPRDTWCQAEIKAAIDTHSKSGNEMIQADFLIYDPIGLQPTIRHYFVSTQPGFLKKLCAAADIDFSTGNIPAEKLVGKTMYVLIKIQEDKTGQFPDKNVLAAFSKEPPADVTVQPPAPRKVESAEIHDTEIPF